MSIVLKCLEPRPMATKRLICVPHAGAGASIYRPWLALLPETIELYALQLPKREERYQAPALQDWESVEQALEEVATKLSPIPTVIFGHSLGSLLALLLARKIETWLAWTRLDHHPQLVGSMEMESMVIQPGQWLEFVHQYVPNAMESAGV